MSTKPNSVKAFADVKTLVLKIGTSLLTGEEGFDGSVLEEIVKEVARIKHERGLNILIVSSGAIGCGMAMLGLKERPSLLPMKQATAAVGQARLMHYYETLFQRLGQGLRTAQVLLSASDLDNRQTYLNVRNTVQALFELGTVVPIINENDSVAIEELRFGDNDTLSARIAVKIGADLLILLSDVDGLHDKNPFRHDDAKLIPRVEGVTEAIEALAEDSTAATTIGGMRTKLDAAKIACASGIPMVIANGRRPHVVSGVLDGEGPSTTFGGTGVALPERKRWIAFGRAPRGKIVIDDGARRALVEQGKSLLAAGITGMSGEFAMGDAVRICDERGSEIASGLVNYSSDQVARIKGCKSTQIEAILGRKDFDEVIHRDNLVIL